MKIAVTVDPEIPVPPLYYGGIERIVSMIVEEFITEGHEVTLFAHESSKTSAILKPYSGKSSKSRMDTLRNTHLISKEIFNGSYDILHSFSRLAYLTFILPSSLPKVMSYQRRPTASQIVKAQKLAYKNSLTFTGCSDFISNQIEQYGPVTTVYNGFTENVYAFSENITEGAPLIFIGRVEPVKGAHHAIDIALRAGKKLIIAGNVPPEYQNYFDQNIAPFVDGRQIQYIGPVNDIQKSELLTNALAFLMPIEWDEPFGIVMVEAMACGTPVIALNRGAVSEIIKNNKTGFICEDIDECVERVKDVHILSRKFIRDEVTARFSAKVISRKYLDLYESQLKKSKLVY